MLKDHVGIGSLTAERHRGVAVVRFLVGKGRRAARGPLNGAGRRALEKQVFQLFLPDRPGEVSRLLKSLADEGLTVVSR